MPVPSDEELGGGIQGALGTIRVHDEGPRRSWRGRVLTLYVLTYGLFYGAGQLVGQNLDVRGPEFLIIAGISTTLALVPMVLVSIGFGPQIDRALHADIIEVLV